MRSVPLMTFDSLRSVVCAPVESCLALTLVGGERVSRPSPHPFVVAPSTGNESRPVSVFHARRRLQSSFDFASRRASLGARHAYPGSRPSSRHLTERPLTRRLPRPRFVPSSGFLSLSTAFSAPRSVGLFHPTATSRVPRPFRGSFSPCSRPSSSKDRAPLVFGDRRAHPYEYERPPLGRLPFEALLHTKARCPRHRFHAASPPAPLLGFLSPPGLVDPRRRSAYRSFLRPRRF